MPGSAGRAPDAAATARLIAHWRLGLGDGSTHQYNDLPLIVAGGGGGTLKLGQHVHCKTGTPLANLWLTQLNVLGMERETYADSSGTLAEILA